MTVTFDSAGSIGGSPVALTMGAANLDFALVSGGNCKAGIYEAGSSCTVSVSFTPKFAGQRKGGVVLKDEAGVAVATGYMHGFGAGPQVSYLPGRQSTLGGGFGYPNSIAVDGSGNVFVADDGYPAGTTSGAKGHVGKYGVEDDLRQRHQTHCVCSCEPDRGGRHGKGDGDNRRWRHFGGGDLHH